MQSEQEMSDRIEKILAEIKPLAAEYYLLTGKPLGVTGEIAEYHAARILGLELAPARTAGYDAIRLRGSVNEKIQIKGRAFGQRANPGQRIGTIKHGADCDAVILVIMDNETLEALEIWEAPYPAVLELLLRPGSRARDRGQLSISAFKAVAKRAWTVTAVAQRTRPAGLFCPECGREFVDTWGGIDAHWKAKHDHIMGYEDAWPLIKAGIYTAGASR